MPKFTDWWPPKLLGVAMIRSCIEQRCVYTRERLMARRLETSTAKGESDVSNPYLRIEASPKPKIPTDMGRGNERESRPRQEALPPDMEPNKRGYR